MSGAPTRTARDRLRASLTASRRPDRGRPHGPLSEPRAERRFVRQHSTQLRRPSTTYDYAGQDPVNGYDLNGTCNSILGCIQAAGNWLIRAENSQAGPIVKPVIALGGAIRSTLSGKGTGGACLFGAGVGGAVDGEAAMFGGCLFSAVLHKGEESKNPYVRDAATALDLASTGKDAAHVATEGPSGLIDLLEALKKLAKHAHD